MSEVYGWTGKILRVDLSSSEVSTVDTMKYVPDFIGGLGVASRIAWEELSPGVDAFDPENMLFVMVGPLTGTTASGAGRVEVLGIAPQQHPPVFSRSGMGGHWGPELKYAGYDGIIIQGRAEEPVYLWVHDSDVEILDASKIWGRGTYGATRALRVRHGWETRVISCGQAGEHLSRIAIMQTETGNAAGQGGYGGVMGSKNLKAIAVRGTMGVKIARPQEFLDLCINASREGQRGDLNSGSRSVKQADIQTDRDGNVVRRRKCGFCITPCIHRIYENVQATDGLSVPSVARHCWGYMGKSSKVDLTARAITSDYGLNGWEITYGIIPWLEMCKQHGLIDKIDGIEIPIPDEPIGYMKDTEPYSAEFVHTLVHKIAFREGELGDALADGACYAADRLFGGAGIPLLDRIYPRHCGQTEHWGGHWGPGGGVYYPWWLPPILQWCIDTRDPANDSTHQWTEHVQPYMPESGPHRGPFSLEKVSAVCAKVYGNPDIVNPAFEYDPPELKAIPAIWHSHRGMVVDSLILCDYENTRVFSTLSEDGSADTALMSNLFSACTGYDVSEVELDRSGERIWNQLRAIDVRNFGRNRNIDESTIDGFMYPGKDDGVMLDREKFLTLLDKYYELSGWDLANGHPTRAKLEQLGLSDIADGLKAV
ncbi:aldehyde ferredoxin oxidoreductase N-terminal domain-containing protein [Candidatus Poribacteria bacterium]